MSYLTNHYDEIFKKYDTNTLLKDIDNFQHGKGKLYKVLNHFFEECIFECKNYRSKKTPMEALGSDEDMEFILSYIKSKPKFYTGGEITNIKSFFRNGGRLACKVANFPVTSARDIYFKYFPDYQNLDYKLNCLDTSAGFGSRMSAVILSGHNYCGFDPNKKLFNQLVKYRKFLIDNDLLDNQRCGLYCCGSEIHKPELCDTFDVSFTSPPYFNVETYGCDNEASSRNYNNYDKWIEEFVVPTINNTYKYLKHDGYAMINIKNMTSGDKKPLFDDWFSIFKNHAGFKYIEVFDMKLTTPKYYTKKTNYTIEEYHGFKEPIMVFQKI